MQIQLFPYERLILETLEQEYALDRELMVGFALSLNQLACLFEEIALHGENEFKAGRVAIIGLINHTHHLLIGGLQALEVGNGHVWSACIRGLVETFGACVIISEKPATAPNFLGKGIKAGKLRSAAERAQPGLGKDIDRLNNIVHPASGAIYAGFQVVDPGAWTTQFRFGLHKPATDEGREGVTVLANFAALIVDKLQQLAARKEVLTIGKVIMQRTAESKEDT